MKRRTWKAWAVLNGDGSLCETLIRDTRKKAQEACAALIGRSWHGLSGLGCRAVRVEIREVPPARARKGRK